MFDGEDVDYANAEISVLKELALKSVLESLCSETIPVALTVRAKRAE